MILIELSEPTLQASNYSKAGSDEGIRANLDMIDELGEYAHGHILIENLM